MEPEVEEVVRGISTRVFAERMSALIAALNEDPSEE
jgi:hypothetical protein